jgi:hypothetical protein
LTWTEKRAVVKPVERPLRRLVAPAESGDRISSVVVGGSAAPSPSSVANPAIG